MNHFKILLPLFSICLFYTISCNAQTIQTVDFIPEAWEISAKKHEFVNFKGKQSLFIQNGQARLKDSSFKNGIIDFDIAIAESLNFAGVHFRIDGDNCEEFYLRPHQSGNPDATQYTPVINGSSAWQLYGGKDNAAAYNFNFNEWMHIRLIINEGKADIFINDMSQPFLHIADLKLTPTTGQIGFTNFLGTCYFANLTYQKIDNPLLLSEEKPLPTPAKEVISKWQVSTAFAETLLDEIGDLSDFPIMKNLAWQTFSVEPSGTINLSRASSISKETNMVLVKAVIRSDKEQLKRIDFGYSDATILFINQEAIYKGHNRFRSRDYRYLGTIGYFDSVFLPLKKGRNELIFAVSERMGGWGLKAKLADLDDLVIE